MRNSDKSHKMQAYAHVNHMNRRDCSAETFSKQKWYCFNFDLRNNFFFFLNPMMLQRRGDILCCLAEQLSCWSTHPSLCPQWANSTWRGRGRGWALLRRGEGGQRWSHTGPDSGNDPGAEADLLFTLRFTASRPDPPSGPEPTSSPLPWGKITNSNYKYKYKYKNK